MGDHQISQHPHNINLEKQQMYEETNSHPSEQHKFNISLVHFSAMLKLGLNVFSQQQLQQFLTCLQKTINNNTQEVCLGLQALSVLLKQGGSKQVSENKNFLKTIIKHFNYLSQQIDQCKAQTQFKMFTILSFLAQIIYENKNCVLPFNRKFLNTLFYISSDLISQSEKRKEICRILSVILEYLSLRSEVIIECNLFSRFRQTLLSSFKTASDPKSLQRLIRALSRTHKVQPLILSDITSSGVINAIQKFFRKEATNIMMARLNLQSHLHVERVKANRYL